MAPFSLFKKCLSLSLLSFSSLLAKEAVTYEFSGGRFGDNLIAYLHAKWLSYTHEIPLVYRPFEYSSELALDQPESIETYEATVELEFGKTIEKCGASTLYVLPYFPEDPFTLLTKGPSEGKKWAYIPVDWKDAGFRKLARELVAPKEKLQLITPPKGCISIAVHVREGGGFDSSYAFKELPLKFPPISFYIKGLQEISSLFKNKSIYCYIFTDAKDPENIVRKFKKAMGRGAPIVFDYRRRGNHHESNVLEDFFSLFNFDALIRPQSSFSHVPSLLKDYAAVYSPISFKVNRTFFMKKKRGIVHEIEFEKNFDLINELNFKKNL